MDIGDLYRGPPQGPVTRRRDPYDVGTPPIPPNIGRMDSRSNATPTPGSYPPTYPPSTGGHENPFQHPSDNVGDWGSSPPVPPPPQPYAQLGRTESNQSYSTPYMPDHRLSSPPQLFPSSNSAPGFSQSGPYGHPLEDDTNDAQPLLNSHSRPNPIFNPHSTPPPSHAPYDPPMPGGGGGRVRFDQPYGDHGWNEQERNNLHYGPPPARVLRRNRTQKRVQLFRGNLVLDADIPSKLLDMCNIKEGNEFTKMRYTAVTCQADDFVKEKYSLRQTLYERERKVELFIVVTMYNEEDDLFCRTMRGIMQNVAYLCTKNKDSATWSNEGWKKVVVCIVSDGRLNINKRTQSVLAALGVYQDGVARNVVNNKPVVAHLYEYTTQCWIDKNLQVVPGRDKAFPVQLIFCLKEKNAKKINSHRWFFNAFGEHLQPNVCVLLDAGTMPGSQSIFHLWKAFDKNRSIGGACGEIVALKGKMGRNLLNPLVAAQDFEYKMSNILDKPLESAFGYITVLPGAFSAYRYEALQNDKEGNGPLEKYFYGEKMHDTNAGIFKANMYLAEDRILCWELVSKRGASWTLHYVKSASAITDVPDEVPELVSQRRRWLNGSFFAAVHSIAHFHYIYRSSHSPMRMFWLHVELLYQVIANVFGWFALGNYYIAFVVLSKSMELSVKLAPGEPPFDEFGNLKTNKIFYWINQPLQYLYLALLLLCFLLSLGNRPAGSKKGYTFSMVGFALITVYMIFAAVWLTVAGINQITQKGASVGELVKNNTFRNIIMSLLATYGLYVVASLLAFDPRHMVTSFVQYLLLAPSYINVLNVYAFSNVHDVSWGTKGSDKASEDLGVVKSSGDSGEVTVDVFSEQKDLNAIYEAELAVLRTPVPKQVKKQGSEQQRQEDYYKNFRTNVLLWWTLSNAALAIVILRVGGDGQFVIAQTYMAVMLYTVAGLAFFRFLGLIVYLVVRLFMI
ncbi:hypothetical protein CspHIS471_0304110 [Cutaneotrichosporon sp. HIS471]|nr:hypothetical protein CspHIS471_0304110 [Cutaneotrichosporon sp. HIS471]